jgi:hypothetical protein
VPANRELHRSAVASRLVFVVGAALGFAVLRTPATRVVQVGRSRCEELSGSLAAAARILRLSRRLFA